MKRIAVDMDGVLADTFEQFLVWQQKETGIKDERDKYLGIPESEAIKNIRTYVYTNGFFRDIPVIEDSQRVLFELQKKYEIFIVSAATEFPQSLPEKQAWLGEHFPFIQWQHIVFCGYKTIVHADIMIDDHLKNLDPFPNKTFLFTAPHNHYVKDERHQRVNSWKEIEEILL